MWASQGAHLSPRLAGGIQTQVGLPSPSFCPTHSPRLEPEAPQLPWAVSFHSYLNQLLPAGAFSPPHLQPCKLPCSWACSAKSSSAAPILLVNSP